MKEELKKTYRGFVGWLRYVRDYKDNIDNDLVSEQRLIEANKKIEKLNADIQVKSNQHKDFEDLLEIRENRIKKFADKISELQRERKEYQATIVELQKHIEELTKKTIRIEHSRRQSAGAIGGLKAKVNDLTKELEKANYTIDYYRNNRKKPNIEEIKAYEYSRKAVEKRIKENDR